jgi:hypothetical protein
MARGRTLVRTLAEPWRTQEQHKEQGEAGFGTAIIGPWDGGSGGCGRFIAEIRQDAMGGKLSGSTSGRSRTLYFESLRKRLAALITITISRSPQS